MSEEARSHFYRQVESLRRVARCPTCTRTGLEGIGGALHCRSCHSIYPERDGFIDFEPRVDVPSAAQRVMNSLGYPLVYERVVRPFFTRYLMGHSMDSEFRRTLTLLGLEKGHRALDVACGTGLFARRFAAELGGDGLVVGVDRSYNMLAKAHRLKLNSQLEELAFLRGDAGHLPLADASFDRAHCAAALHLMPEPQTALVEMRRVLVPGGRLVLSTFVAPETGPGSRLLAGLLHRSVGIQGFAIPELLGMVELAGFRVDWRSTSGLAIILRAIAID